MVLAGTLTQPWYWPVHSHGRGAGHDTHIVPKGYGPEVFILQFQYTIQCGGLKTTTYHSYDINKGKSFTILAKGNNCMLVTSLKIKHILNSPTPPPPQSTNRGSLLGSSCNKDSLVQKLEWYEGHFEVEQDSC